MKVNVSNEITIVDPTPEIKNWCKKNLVIENPDFEKKIRMHLWLGNTPEKLYMYKIDSGNLILPYGVFKRIYPMISDCNITMDFPKVRKVDFKCTIDLFDYQEPAVDKLYSSGMGILESKAGSGKTMMGLALASKLGCKTLWLTHTHDLLNQSKERAAEYMDTSLFGEITSGKVNIGEGITFATVQTLAKQDLNQYKNTWDCVIVDECHRVAGTPTTLNQFSSVLSALACKHKYGMSATVHRADGMTKSIFNYLGDIAYTVPEEAIADKVMNVTVVKKDTGIEMSDDCLDTDGTVIYAKLINYLADNIPRNFQISNDLIKNADHYNLILSDRLEHLRFLISILPDELQNDVAMIDGSMTSKTGKEKRKQAIEDLRTGKKHYLFASYRLAKEGLDIPRLDRLYLTTPQKDYSVVTQSVGRIARTFEGKGEPICYDYVDNIGYLKNAFKVRCRHYRKDNCRIEE